MSVTLHHNQRKNHFFVRVPCCYSVQVNIFFLMCAADLPLGVCDGWNPCKKFQSTEKFTQLFNCEVILRYDFV